jgi:hypothetical protein
VVHEVAGDDLADAILDPGRRGGTRNIEFGEEIRIARARDQLPDAMVVRPTKRCGERRGSGSNERHARRVPERSRQSKTENKRKIGEFATALAVVGECGGAP